MEQQKEDAELRIHIDKEELTWAGWLFLIVTVHYLWWWIPLSILAFYILINGGWMYLVGFSVIYLPWFLNGAHLNLGYPWHAFRRSSVWRYGQTYGGLDLVRVKPLDPKKQYVFGFHPHGILILSRIGTYGGTWEQLFPGIETRVLGATPMFWIVAAREICLWLGAIDAGRKSAVRALKAGFSLIVYPGGSQEIFLTDPSSNDVTIVLKKRKGFVRLALEHGADLVPVVAFGERHCFHILHIDQAIKDWFLRVLKVPLLLFWGRHFTWMPLDKPMAIVFGEPIPVTKVENCTDAQVDELHQRYTEAVQKLWDQYRSRFPYATKDNLVIR